MLEIVIPERDSLFDEAKNEFISIKGIKIQLEHSLISIQNWEKKWHKPFLDKKEKTAEEILDYIRCMTLTPNVNPECYHFIPKTEIEKIKAYIDDPMTATWFSEKNGPSQQTAKREVITAEIIYYWMISYQIPMEYRKWHLNQLLTLIRVCGVKNAPSKKMSKNSILSQNAKLNAARRAKMHSKG